MIASITRRQSLSALLASFGIACSPPSVASNDGERVEARADEDLLDDHIVFEDSVDAAFETILPAERDAAGRVTVPGAREAGAGRLLESEGFGLFALAQGFVPKVSDRALAIIEQTGPAIRAALNVELDVLASARRPLVAFADLPAKLREEILGAALDDPTRAGPMLLVRAACLTAYLGAVTSDVGLRAVGFPPFEDFANGRAVSGYPRTRSGRLVDAANEDLLALAAHGDLDDYTFDRAPEPTPEEDLSAIVNAAGDLV